MHSRAVAVTVRAEVWVGRQERQLRYSICGTRAFMVRVASRADARVTICVSVP